MTKSEIYPIVGDDVSAQWLRLEVGTARSLMRLHKVSWDVVGNGRVSLVATAAKVFFPEVDAGALPRAAAVEVQNGLAGSWRRRFAACAQSLDADLAPFGDAEEAQWKGWAAEMLKELTPERGPNHAIAVHDAVHLSRLVRGVVPPIVAAECLVWATLYRFDDPHPAMFRTIEAAAEAWLHEPRRREQLDQEILECAISVVGESPQDPTLIPI